jgi:hypothetical protein
MLGKVVGVGAAWGKQRGGAAQSSTEQIWHSAERAGEIVITAVNVLLH